MCLGALLLLSRLLVVLLIVLLLVQLALLRKTGKRYDPVLPLHLGRRRLATGAEAAAEESEEAEQAVRETSAKENSEGVQRRARKEMARKMRRNF